MVSHLGGERRGRSQAGAGDFGSLSWGERRAGRLTRLESVAEARRSIAVQLRNAPDALRVRLGRDRGGGDLAELPDPPDSMLCRQALEAAREADPGPLLGHAQRCWLWAALLSRPLRLSPDPELLYCACLLHDLGLSAAHRPAGGCGCFAVAGAHTARGLLVGWGCEPGRAETVGEAICRHFNAEVPLAAGSEAHLLHEAAFLDVVGNGAGRLSGATRRAVVERHPRAGFATAFDAAMSRERRERPRSRAALGHRLGSSLLIALNPLDR